MADKVKKVKTPKKIKDTIISAQDKIVIDLKQDENYHKGMAAYYKRDNELLRASNEVLKEMIKDAPWFVRVFWFPLYK